MLDERLIPKFAAKDPSHGGDVVVGRAWNLFENIETVHVFDSASIAAVRCCRPVVRVGRVEKRHFDKGQSLLSIGVKLTRSIENGWYKELSLDREVSLVYVVEVQEVAAAIVTLASLQCALHLSPASHQTHQTKLHLNNGLFLSSISRQSKPSPVSGNSSV